MDAERGERMFRAKPANRVDVLHVGPDPSAIGGMETVLRTYRDLRLDSISMRVLGTTSPRRRGQAALLLKAICEMRRLRRQGRRIVHVHLSHRGSFVREGALVMVSRLLGHRTVITIHGSEFVHTSRSRKWRWIYGLVIRSASVAATLNREAMSAARELSGGRKIQIMLNPGPLLPRRRAQPSACDPIAMLAGVVGERKGVQRLCESWPEVRLSVPGARLILAGPADGTVDLSGLPEGVEFIGPATPGEVHELLGRSRVAVLPSRAEAMPMFLIEALGMATPIVVTDVGAMPRLAEGCGAVVSEDGLSLNDALVAYLGDGRKADQDGESALRKFAALFGAEAVERDLSRLYAPDDAL